MHQLLSGDPEQLDRSVEEFGSPINFVHPATMAINLQRLNEVAATRKIDFRPFFARKANKCLAFVDTALECGAGIDVASEQELHQALDRGAPGESLICTAAIKSKELIKECIQRQVVIVLDNLVELQRVIDCSESLLRIPQVAIRLGGFNHRGTKLPTRFGFDVESIFSLMANWPKCRGEFLKIKGLHFHLDGYCADQRVSAIRQSLEVFDHLSQTGHSPEFLDIGGGLPISYLESEVEWAEFWSAHESALLGRQEPLTYRNHGLGLAAINGELHGKRNVYPYYQELVRDEWLAKVLDAPIPGLGPVAEQLNARKLQLRCEPGRSILDGCGMTVARVEFVKQSISGDWFIGLAMNRTQCRTSSDDFLIDPILRPSRRSDEATTGSAEGFFVGAYCTESELISLRKFKFCEGVRVGDLVAYPNTAGYFMHFLESRSHQFPLAKNLVVSALTSNSHLDAIDESERQALP